MSADYVSIIDDTTLTTLGAMTLSMSISDRDDAITIYLTGPSSVYFSIGIGSCDMTDSWALVVPGSSASDGTTPFEQILANNKPGSTLAPSFEVEEDMTYGLLRTVTFTRPLSTSLELDDTYYAFSTDDDELIVMWAYGSGADYANHGEYQRGCNTLSFAKTMETEEQRIELSSSDWSYVFGQSTASLIVVFVLLSIILIIAAFRYYMKGHKWTQINHLINREEYIPI
eukprot:527363_1